MEISIGSRVSVRLEGKIIFGINIEHHSKNEKYYRIMFSKEEAEKFKDTYGWYETWEHNGGWLWITKSIIRRACRLNRKR